MYLIAPTGCPFFRQSWGVLSKEGPIAGERGRIVRCLVGVELLSADALSRFKKLQVTSLHFWIVVVGFAVFAHHLLDL